MENNDSTNPKPQQTGGLKLMTVFIGVLALHVVVIGGFTVYHLMSGGTTDADLVTDKNHKNVKVTPDSATVSDGQLSDAVANEKNATASNTPQDTSGNPVTIPAPPAENTAAAAPAPTPAPTPAPVMPAPASMAAQPTANTPSGSVITPSASASAVADQTTTPIDTDATGGTAYLVKSHDSLARIAHRNHVKLAALRSANGLKTDKLHIGQKLIIPAKTQLAANTSAEDSTPAPVKSSGPDRTLLGDAIPEKKVAGSPRDKATVSAAANGRHSYTVAKGDTLNKIAHKFHTSSAAIMSLNSISDAKKLRPGQKLRIPSKESRSATSTPATTQPEQIQPRATPSAQLANFIP